MVQKIRRLRSLNSICDDVCWWHPRTEQLFQICDNRTNVKAMVTRRAAALLSAAIPLLSPGHGCPVRDLEVGLTISLFSIMRASQGRSKATTVFCRLLFE